MWIRAVLASASLLTAVPSAAGESPAWFDAELLQSITPMDDTSYDPRPGDGEILLIQFWASWCHSCGSIMWDMDDLVGRYGHVKYIAVSLDDQASDATDYIRRHPLYGKYRGRYFTDDAKRLSSVLDVATVPTILLVDGDGRVLVRKQGHLNSDDLKDLSVAMQLPH